MAIALQNLRRRLGRPQADTGQRGFFDLRGDIGVRADGTRQLAHAELVACLLEPLAVAPHLRHEHRELVPERRRLGMDAVGPPMVSVYL